MGKFVEVWGKAVFFFVCLAIALLGVGRIEIPTLGVSFSSWSVSRTVFFFWLIWKVLMWIVNGKVIFERWKTVFPLSLVFFFVLVTASLLRGFSQGGDYRYFVFAFFHYIMVADLFFLWNRRRLLLCLLGIAPGFLLLRGIFADPSVLSLKAMVRFGYPLDHPNTAGYLLSMSLPLAVAVWLSYGGWVRRLAFLSSISQFAGLILTFSRAAWAGGLIALLVISLKERRLRNGALLLGLLGLVVLLFIGPLRSRVFSFANALDDPDVVWRFQVASYAFAIGTENPLLGVGYGRDGLRAALQRSYPVFYKQRYVHHSHNVYAELAAGVGFLGLSTFLWLLGSTVFQLLKKAKGESITGNRPLFYCLLASVFAFAVTGLGDVPFYHHETRIYFFSLLALCHLCLKEKADTVSPPNQI